MTLLPDLITTDEYLAATGTASGDVDSTDAAQIAWAITSVSQSIRDYADRDFVLTTDAVQGPRTYTYEGGFELEIDDAITVSQVDIAPTTFDSGRTLDATEWYTQSNKDGTIDTIKLFTLFGRSGSYSPAMGFKSNLDTLDIIPYPVQLTITAVWGWNDIPPNVKQAAVLGVIDFIADPADYNAESIANYSRTVSASRSASSTTPINALPERALALLEGYLRWQV